MSTARRSDVELRRVATPRRLGDTCQAMPEESTTPDLVERVGRLFEAANRRDFDAVMSFCDQPGRRSAVCRLPELRIRRPWRAENGVRDCCLRPRKRERRPRRRPVLLLVSMKKGPLSSGDL
jgi:hypothetical protein